MKDMKKLSILIENGKLYDCSTCVHLLLDKGFSPETILRDGIMPGMAEVGRKFEQREIYIPELLLAARASKFATEALRLRMDYLPPVSKNKIVLGTVQSDLHDIGKNLVSIAMQCVGIEVIDLGVDVPPHQFVSAVERDRDVTLVGISALLTTTLPEMKSTVEALRHCNAADRISILVGGAPVTAKFAKNIGADIYTDSAFSAAKAAHDNLIQRGLLT